MYTSDNAKTMTDNSNGKSSKVISSTDSTSTSRSNLGRDQLSNDKNDQKVYLSGKTLGKKIISDVDTYLKQCLENPTLWITFDRHIIPMTDKAVLAREELSDRHIQMARFIIKKQFPLL